VAVVVEDVSGQGWKATWFFGRVVFGGDLGTVKGVWGCGEVGEVGEMRARDGKDDRRGDC